MPDAQGEKTGKGVGETSRLRRQSKSFTVEESFRKTPKDDTVRVFDAHEVRMDQEVLRLRSEREKEREIVRAKQCWSGREVPRTWFLRGSLRDVLLPWRAMDVSYHALHHPLDTLVHPFADETDTTKKKRKETER